MKSFSLLNTLAIAVIALAQSAVGITARAAEISNCDEAGLQAALNAGGNFTFACDGVIGLSHTLTVSRDVVLDGTAHNVSISGSNAVRIFYVSAGVRLTLVNLTLANGRNLGTNGIGSGSGEPGIGGAVFIDGGSADFVGCTFSNNMAF